MQLTPEQEAIIEAAKSTKDSLLISALAGAAKTTTLVAAAHKLPLVPTFCGAFNKRIADEMAKRMPAHIQCATMNSIGHKVWGQAIGRRLVVDTDKGYSIITSQMEALPADRRKEFGEMFTSLLRALRGAKSAGYVPADYLKLGNSLLSEEEFIFGIGNQLDVNPDETFMAYLNEALARSIAYAYEGKIDFDDQIYMSTCFRGVYPRFPILMVDEAQDLSPLNHATLGKMYGGRIIAVGDPNQAIYAFRGADSNSMATLQQTFDMKEMHLNVSFRCPKAVIRRARSRAPEMAWPDWAEEGEVDVLDTWNVKTFEDGAAVICRNNAPLLSLAMRMIKQGRGCRVVGVDIGKSLTTLLKKISGKETLTSEALLLAIDEWEKTAINKAHQSRKAAIRDRAECLRVFAASTSNTAEAIAFCEHVFTATGSVTLLTGHKSKGEEWDNVYHLNPYLIPSRWAKEAAEEGDNSQMEQELNLRYVIETRAKKKLCLINLEDMQ